MKNEKSAVSNDGEQDLDKLIGNLQQVYQKGSQTADSQTVLEKTINSAEKISKPD